MNKQQVLEHLKYDVYCRIRPSGIHGVGVFAIRDIPKGENPFRGANTAYDEFTFTAAELEDIHPEVRKLVGHFFNTENDIKKDHITVPSNGINAIDISFFMNHSTHPNVIPTGGGIFKTIKEIKTGEELLINYTDFDV